MHTPARNNFDALRLVGALLVLISHQFALSGRREPMFVGDHSFGNLGVLVFFSISGYLVTSSWLNDPHILRFCVRRTLRMLPALCVSIPLTLAVIGALGLIGFPDNPGISRMDLSGRSSTRSAVTRCFSWRVLPPDVQPPYLR